MKKYIKIFSVLSLALSIFGYASRSLAADMLIRIDDLNFAPYVIEINGAVVEQVPENIILKVDVVGRQQVAVYSKEALLSEVVVNLEQEDVAEIHFFVKEDALESSARIFSSGENFNTGVIAGIVKSSFEDVPITSAGVKIDGVDTEVLTDESGMFKADVPVGVRSVEVSSPGHIKNKKSNFAVFTGDRTLLEVILQKATDEQSTHITQEVLVLGVMAGIPTASAEIERESSTVMDVLNSDDLSRSGDSSVASAITRVTGVSVVDNKFAVVRGLAGRYISSSLDGGLLPSTDFLRRDVPLDLFPSGILDGIHIEKSYRPELPGDTTGGVIGMRAKGLPEDKINTLSVSIGMNSEVLGKDVLTYHGGSRDALGYDDGSREVPRLVNDFTDFGRGKLPDVCPQSSVIIPGCVEPSEFVQYGKSLTNIYDVDVDSGSPEYGIAYAYGERFSLTNGDFGFYSVFDYGQKWESRNNATIDSSIREGNSDFVASEDTSYQRTTRKVDLSGYLALGYEGDNGVSVLSKTILLRKTSDTVRQTRSLDITEDKLYEDTLLQWAERQLVSEKLSVNYTFGEDDNHLIDASLGYSMTSRYEPDRRDYTYENERVIASRIFRKYSNLDEVAMDLSINYQWQIDRFENFHPTLKAGLYGVNKERDFESARFGFLFNGTNEIDPLLPMESIFTPENFDEDYIRLRSQGQSTDYFESTDDVNALYLSSETDFGDSYSLLLGARYESSSQSVDYPLGSESDVIEPLDSNDLLPALMFTWRTSENFQLRAGLSETLSRPGLVERSNTQFFDPDTDEKIIGNPNLMLSNIMNIDIRGEYYFSDEENVSLAVFYKDIKNPIEKTVNAGVRDGYTFRNTDKASILGVEVDFKKILADDGSWYVFLAGNASVIDSEVTLDEETAQLEGIQGQPRVSRPLQGQSEYLANLQFGLDQFEFGHSLTLMLNYFGDRINRVDNVSRGDEMELGRLLMDINYKYEINDNISIDAKINNIFNEDVRFEAIGKSQLSVEKYREGLGLSLGLSMQF